jgi:chloride channel protein, CIC family
VVARAIGGLIIGIGGLIEPRALGVGYDVIDELLTGRAGMSLIIGILVVKTLVWGLSLGSGTSGGVLAPVFMIGGALGALEAHVLPSVTPGFWALIGLSAVVGGVMRSPLTGVVFPLELTHAWPLLTALLIAATAAYTVSALLLRRSVLTEKVAPRGLHLSREYAVDPLEVLLVDEVMHTTPIIAHGQESLAELRARADVRGQWLYPVMEEPAGLLGVIPRRQLIELDGRGGMRAGDVALPPALTAFPDETLRHLARRFASEHVTTAVVVSRADPAEIVGLITVEDLLQGHLRDLLYERRRERVLQPGKLTIPRPPRRRRAWNIVLRYRGTIQRRHHHAHCRRSALPRRPQGGGGWLCRPGGAVGPLRQVRGTCSSPLAGRRRLCRDP